VPASNKGHLTSHLPHCIWQHTYYAKRSMTSYMSVFVLAVSFCWVSDCRKCDIHRYQPSILLFGVPANNFGGRWFASFSTRDEDQIRSRSVMHDYLFLAHFYVALLVDSFWQRKTTSFHCIAWPFWLSFVVMLFFNDLSPCQRQLCFFQGRSYNCWSYQIVRHLHHHFRSLWYVCIALAANPCSGSTRRKASSEHGSFNCTGSIRSTRG
jgi:hypothetical protein